VPQVASDPNVHASSLHMPRVARPAPPDRAPSPFESLIEDTSPAAEPAAPQPASKVAKTDDKPAPAKNKDCKPPEANGDTKPANTEEAATAEETPDDGSPTKVDGKKAAKPKTTDEVGDSIQVQADPKPDAGKKTDDTNATPGTDGIVAIASSGPASIAAAPAQTPNPTPDDGKQVESPVQQLALVADAAPKTKQLVEDLPKSAADKKAEAGKGKPVDEGDQIDTDQPTAEADDALQVLTKDGAPQHAGGKPQTETGDADKQHGPQVHNDAVASNHRADASGPGPTGNTDLAGTTKTPTDTTPQLQIPSAATHSAANTAMPTAPVLQPTPQPVAVPLSGVAIEITGKALEGKNRFEIRLDPPELGRIEVRLDVDRDGNVTSRLTVDRPETLDLLRRDAAGLERALQDAGLKTANNGLQFSLRDQSSNDQQTERPADTALMVATDEVLPSADVIPQRYGRLAGQSGGLDIRV
jgi:chemotaxis protein MotD